jgi:cellulose synthase/poly-beta-1,6-N-acetylglucosamine synthase-like glycosyltransferase
MWWISSWFILYSISIFALIFGIQRLRVVNKNRKTMSLDEITVVIPFRNEAHNLEAFLNGIKSQRYQPEQWIFVNDHSLWD